MNQQQLDQLYLLLTDTAEKLEQTKQEIKNVLEIINDLKE